METGGDGGTAPNRMAAKVLLVLCTPRRHGFTASVLEAAAEGVRSVPGVAAETVGLARYRLRPCMSTFWCARHGGAGCALPDEMGRRGEGVLFRKVRDANGLIVATPVHNWGTSALCHVFFERLYPLLWNDLLAGMPFASIACATNQGMHRLATSEMCKWAFCRGMLWLGGISAHAMDAEERREEARAAGARVAEAALREAIEGRVRPTDEERFLACRGLAWEVLEPYLENLTDGTFDADQSLPARALRQGRFQNPEAVPLLHRCQEALAQVIAARESGDQTAALQHLTRASAYWTNATWKEFVEAFIHGRQRSAAVYRRLPEE